MSTILVKILATALTLGQVTARPEAVKTVFDPARDQAAVAQVLKDGCAHMRRAFDIEDINLDDLIATAMDDPQAVTGEVKVLQGVNLTELHVVYRQFCKGEAVAQSPVDLGAVIDYYNKAVADLPDHTKLKGLRLPGVSVILDGKGQRFTEVFEPDHRRVWVPLKDIPEHVQKAFVAAEDKRFFQHRGIDERGVIRAFVGNLAQPGRPQGGSTITQQVAKNLLVGDDVTYERKMREMIVASRIEKTLSKARSEEHTSELQSRQYLVCRLLLEKKNSAPLTSTAYPVISRSAFPSSTFPSALLLFSTHPRYRSFFLTFSLSFSTRSTLPVCFFLC